MTNSSDLAGTDIGCPTNCYEYGYGKYLVRMDAGQTRALTPWSDVGTMEFRLSYQSFKSVGSSINSFATTYRMLSSNVKVNEEYFVYDFGRLLGNVGGSAGMFVGLSFMDLLSGVVEQAAKCGSKLIKQI